MEQSDHIGQAQFWLPKCPSASLPPLSLCPRGECGSWPYVTIGLANTENSALAKGFGLFSPSGIASGQPAHFILAILETDINLIFLYRGLPELFAAGP